jgi:hypothetical protein
MPLLWFPEDKVVDSRESREGDASAGGANV